MKRKSSFERIGYKTSSRVLQSKLVWVNRFCVTINISDNLVQQITGYWSKKMKSLLPVGICVCAMSILLGVNAFPKIPIGNPIVCPAIACLPCDRVYKKPVLDSRGCNLCKCEPIKDPCSWHICPAGKFCEVDKSRRPVCKCPSICTLQYNPVCGSNGKTYSNGCFLSIDACNYPKDNIKEVGKGPCPTTDGPCLVVQCSKGKHCIAGKWVCSQLSPLLLGGGHNQVVCGSDLNTYTSICHLNLHNCQTGQQVKKIGDGPCCYWKNGKRLCIAKK